jgi:PAS domain S-box-containing protein
MPTDLTALTEDLIRDADGLFAGLLRNAMIGIYIIQDELFRYANPRFAEMFGYTQEEICGAIGPKDLIAPGEEAKVRDAIRQRLDGLADTAHYSFEGLRKDGSRIDLEVFGNRTEFDGRPAIIGMLVDITARCAAERTATERLSFIGQLIEAIPSPLFFKDEQPATWAATRPSRPSLMRPRAELIGRSVFDISPPELAARYHEADQALFDNPGVQTYEASVEATDGMRRDVIFNKATWFRADGSVGGLVGVITDITERKQTEALVWVQANYDTLTGLPNRRLLYDRLGELMKKAHRDHDSVAVLYIDLDRFKEVNDTLGHEAGDQLLMEAARRIVGCVRESDTVARQGGDEFTVLLPGSPTATPWSASPRPSLPPSTTPSAWATTWPTSRRASASPFSPRTPTPPPTS